MKLTQKARKDARKIMPQKTMKEIVTMAHRSAKITHRQGNRRYKEYLFSIKDNTIHSINLFSQSNYVKGDINCSVCQGEGFFDVWEVCQYCDGESCDRCTDGELLKRRRCQCLQKKKQAR